MKINFIYDPNVSFAQMIGYEMAALLWGQLFTDDIEINIFAKGTDTLDSNVIGGAIPEFHEQHYALFLQYYEADITSAEDQAAFDALQQGNTVDFLLNDELISGNTKLKLTTALAKALGMTEAISLERYVLDETEHFLDGTIMMNQDFAWDFNYLRDSEAAENSLDFLSVALHETGHILGFTSSLDFSLQQDTLYSGRTELSDFSPLDLFRFSAASLAQNNPDGVVNDLSIGGIAWFSTDGGETLSAKMSTGKEGDGFQASHWERRYDPLGIMDPTLWYQERASVTDLDVLAFDIMGYNLSSIAGDVENFFTPEGLELLLAQAKVKVATKMGYSLEQLENNATAVPLTSLALFEEMGIDYYTVIPELETTDSTTLPPEPSVDDLGDLSDGELKDFFKDLDKMMDDIYRWWAKNNRENNDDHRGIGRNETSWQEFYEWWAANNSSGNSSWQELFEWWAANNSSGNSSWQELYEWWAANNSSGNSSWQELYEWWAANNSSGNSSWQELFEWWAANNSSGNSSWQELSEEELAKFHEEVAGNQPSWWQEVFFASQDGGNLDNVKLPGWARNLETEVVTQEFHGGHDDDIIGGDVSDDNIVAGKGDDLIDGAAGDDTIFGAGGYDTIFGFDGNDSIMGGVGDDVISGESDQDALFGEAGADVLMGGDDDDYLDGGAGRDFLNGNRGNDALIGGEGDDALEGESGKDLLVGGEGQDIGNGGRGDDIIFGDQYSEIVKQAFGNNLTLLTPSTPLTALTDLYVPEDAPETGSEEIFVVELGQDPLLVEAEAMNPTGDNKLKTLASGEILVQNDSELTLETIFAGTTGLYDIFISYHDVQGTSQIQANLNGTELASWLLDKDLGGKAPEDKNLTGYVIRDVELNNGDSFSLDSIREKNDKGYIDSVQFIPVNQINNPASSSASNLVLDAMRVEAETLNWTGIETKIDNKDFASGGAYLFNNEKNSTITSSYTFNGESGLYNVVLGYYDSAKGEAQVTVDLNGAALDSWSLNLDLNDNPDPMNFVTRTVAIGITLNQGDTLEIEGIRYDDDDKVFLDFLELVPYNPHARIKIEAEYFNLTGNYKVEEQDFASGGRLFKSDDLVTATTKFNGLSGYYDIVIGYYDSNNGEAQLTASLAGTQLDSWLFDKDMGTKNAEATSFVTRKLAQGVMVNEGDILELQGIRDSDDKVYIDYVEFVPVEAPTPPVTEETDPLSPEADLGDNGDILRGGAGNDGIDGGQGNDVIFGEDEFNDSSYIYAPFIDSAFTYGHSSYILTSQPLTWEQAQAEAQSYGGNLVTINDAAEETWLKTTFGTQEWFWLGLNDSQLEGEFEWISGEAITYTNWAPSEPNNLSFSGENADYVRMNYDDGSGTLQWGDNLGDNLLKGIIEIDWSSIGGNDTIFGGAGDDQVYGNSGNDIIYGDSYGNTTSNTPGTLTFQQNVNGYTGTVDTTLEEFYPNSDRSIYSWFNVDTIAGNDDEGQAQALLKFNNIFGSQPGQIALDDTINSAVLELEVFNWGNSIEFYEILQGWSNTDTWNSMGNGIQTDGVEAANTPVVIADVSNTGIVTIDVTASLQAWQANPNSNQGWALLPTGSNGVDINSAESVNAPRLVVDVNQGGSTTINTNSGDLANLPNGKIYNNSLYLLTDSVLSWQAAQAQAESYEGNLVTLNDAAEEQWIQNNFGSSEDFWIGFTDQVIEGQWQWVSGQEVTYTNWHPDNPNNLFNQDHALMNYFGQWDDDYGSKNYRGVIEIELPINLDNAYVHNGSIYLLTDSGMSWDEAQAQAQSLGGNLVTINDAAENQWLKDTFGTSEQLWTGLSDAETEGTFKWVSGEVSDWIVGGSNEGAYSDWSPGEPNDQAGIQDYAILDHWDPNIYGWDDVEGYLLNRGIIEIKLSTTASGGNDNIFGNGGHDTINGGAGNDVVNGTDEVVAGYLERDVLVGGAGADTFILGDDTQAYYATGGNQDYAVIKDFDSSQDTVQLHGTAGDYQQQQQGDDIHLSRNGDLVAILEQNSTLNLNGSGFEYVMTI